jgi:hypothetical protein
MSKTVIDISFLIMLAIFTSAFHGTMRPPRREFLVGSLPKCKVVGLSTITNFLGVILLAPFFLLPMQSPPRKRLAFAILCGDA